MNKLKWRLIRLIYNGAHGTNFNMLEVKIQVWEKIILERLERNAKDEERIKILKEQLNESDTN